MRDERAPAGLQDVADQSRDRAGAQLRHAYAPAIRVASPGVMLFISGATRSPLCHKHRNDRSEHNHPVSIAAQIRLGIQTIRSILSHAPLIWTRAVKVKKYLADMRDMGGMAATMAGFFGEWTPASTTVCVNQLSMPCARVELDMIAIYPKA